MANDDCVKCEKCKGNGWLGKRVPALGRGVYEVTCEECCGYGFVSRARKALEQSLSPEHKLG